MKIVVLDGYVVNPGDIGWGPLEALGELEIYDGTRKEEIIERIGGSEIVFTNKVPITAETIDACNIKFIGVFATGYDVVDTEYARSKGIPVCNVPSYSTEAVCQHVFALLLEICARVGDHNESVKKGEWTSSPYFCYWKHPLIELSGKTMGVVGYGSIGKMTARIAEAMGMKVLVCGSPRGLKYVEGKASPVTFDYLLKNSDVVSFHCPATNETKGMVNKDTLSKMKKGAILINTSIGALINEDDLAEALNSGHLYAAGVDVVSAEPISENNPLLKCGNCFITPHLAWASRDSRLRLLDISASNLKGFLEGKLENAVNMK